MKPRITTRAGRRIAGKHCCDFCPDRTQHQIAYRTRLYPSGRVASAYMAACDRCVGCVAWNGMLALLVSEGRIFKITGGDATAAGICALVRWLGELGQEMKS